MDPRKGDKTKQMGNTGMSKASGQPDNFKQAKGVITRKAMETQLQKKLQIADNDAPTLGDKQGLKDLQKQDKDMKI